MSTIADTFGPGTPPGPSAPADALLVAAGAVARFGASSADFDALTDPELLAAQRDITRLQSLTATRSVWVAKAVAERSRPELGQQGLARQQGFLSAGDLMQDLTGSSKADAWKLVDVGRMLTATDAAEAARQAQADAGAARRVHDDPLNPDGCDTSDGDGSGDRSGSGSGEGPGESQNGLPIEPVALPWHTPIAHAVTNGTLSVAQAHAIRTGLGDIDTVVTPDALATALTTLLEDARTLNLDELIRRARRTRDTLDEAGIAARERKAWDDRYLRVWEIPTGQVRINGLFPPEQGAYIMSVCDSMTGPKRGGVRFVDPGRAAWAKAVHDDLRSTDQLTADGFLTLLKAGSAVNPHRILGGRNPSVRILKTQQPITQPTSRPTTQPAVRPMAQPSTGPSSEVTNQPDGDPITQSTAAPAAESAPTFPPAPLTLLPPAPLMPLPPAPPQLLRQSTDCLVPIPDGTGHGFIEGNPAPVSRETIDRLICDSGTIDVTFDPTGHPLDVGRDERLFTPAQRIALAARDGGCMWPGCSKPPAHTETHHIQHWLRDHGRTDTRLGILLCNPHHRFLHNQGWQILEHQGRYWLRPPATVDRGQNLMELHSTSPAAIEQRRHNGN